MVHIDAAIGQLAYDLLKRYARSGGLRTFDSLIAATAITRSFELVSRNRKHFAMIDGLRLESAVHQNIGSWFCPRLAGGHAPYQLRVYPMLAVVYQGTVTILL